MIFGASPFGLFARPVPEAEKDFLMSQSLTITFDDYPDRVRLVLSGSAHTGAESIWSGPFTTAAELRRAKVELDLGQVDFVSSAFVGAVITLGRRVSSYGGQLRVTAIQPPVSEVFRLSKMSTLLSFD